MIIGVSRGSVWSEAWSQGQQMTGYARIDSLMAYYDLHPIGLVLFSSGYDLAILRSGRPLNIKALANIFMENIGFQLAEPRLVAFSLSNDITVQLHSDHFLVIYQLRSGFYLGNYTWTFKVYKNGNVEFVGLSNSPELVATND